MFHFINKPFFVLNKPPPWRVQIFSHHLTRPLSILRMCISKGACTATRLAYINRTLFAQGQSRNKPLNTLIRSCLFRGSYIISKELTFPE